MSLVLCLKFHICDWCAFGVLLIFESPDDVVANSFTNNNLRNKSPLCSGIMEVGSYSMWCEHSRSYVDIVHLHQLSDCYIAVKCGYELEIMNFLTY